MFRSGRIWIHLHALTWDEFYDTMAFEVFGSQSYVLRNYIGYLETPHRSATGRVNKDAPRRMSNCIRTLSCASCTVDCVSIHGDLQSDVRIWWTVETTTTTPSATSPNRKRRVSDLPVRRSFDCTNMVAKSREMSGKCLSIRIVLYLKLFSESLFVVMPNFRSSGGAMCRPFCSFSSNCKPATWINRTRLWPRILYEHGITLWHWSSLVLYLKLNSKTVSGVSLFAMPNFFFTILPSYINSIQVKLRL